MQYLIDMIHNLQDRDIILNFENMNKNLNCLLIFSALHTENVVTALLSDLQFNKIKSKKQIKTLFRKSFLKKHKRKFVDLDEEQTNNKSILTFTKSENHNNDDLTRVDDG